MDATGDDRHGSRFRDLMARIKEGDQQAAWQLLDEYGTYLLHVIRRHLPAQLRSKYDSTDFFQNVWASFFRKPDVFQRFDGPKDLLNYLRGMARNKLTMESRRRFGTAKYDVTREASLDDPRPETSRTETMPSLEPADSRQPAPSYVAMVREQWNQWMAKQSPQNQQIVDLRFRGASFDEIASQLKINERTARRIIDSLIHELSPAPEEQDSPPSED